MNLDQIRKHIIVALCSDDELLNILVLKGGNALTLVHGIGNRASVDIDFSISTDFKDVEEAKGRLFEALELGFSAHGFVAFDMTFSPKPSRNPIDPEWGGYSLEFKLIGRQRFGELDGNLHDLRRQSLDIDPSGSSRKFKVDISKFEYTTGKEEVEIDDTMCYVYTLPMIAAEKIRAICQQFDEYPLVKNPRPRSRDFYDLYEIVIARALDLGTSDFRELVEHMFGAKKVPLSFIGRVSESYDFHAQDWSSVAQTIEGEGMDFRDYFDFVLTRLEALKPLWIE